jgi:subtilase family serine protease
VTPTTSTLDTPNLVVMTDDLAVFTPDYVVTAAEVPAQLTIQATVRNLGGVDAFNVPVQFVAMGASGWEVLGEVQMIDWLSAGGSTPVEVVHELAENASYREVRVLVDPQNTIAEATEVDNLASKQLVDDQ